MLTTKSIYTERSTLFIHSVIILSIASCIWLCGANMVWERYIIQHSTKLTCGACDFSIYVICLLGILLILLIIFTIFIYNPLNVFKLLLIVKLVYSSKHWTAWRLWITTGFLIKLQYVHFKFILAFGIAQLIVVFVVQLLTLI